MAFVEGAHFGARFEHGASNALSKPRRFGACFRDGASSALPNPRPFGASFGHADICIIIMHAHAYGKFRKRPARPVRSFTVERSGAVDSGFSSDIDRYISRVPQVILDIYASAWLLLANPKAISL